MQKGNYTAIFISVIIHLLLLLALVYSSVKTPIALRAENKTEPAAIKSFLYVRPKKSVPKEIKPVPQKTNIKPKKTTPAQKSPAKPVATKSVQPKEVIASKKPTPKEVTAKITKDVAKLPIKNEKPVQIKRFSSLSNLSQLREKLDQQNRAQAFNESNKHRSASLMHDEQIPVPKTVVPLTQDQQKELNTSSSHYSAITKNGDGTCTIRREQMLGSPVPATTSVFACGESDFDRSFREHMNKVRSKLQIKKH